MIIKILIIFMCLVFSSPSFALERVMAVKPYAVVTYPDTGTGPGVLSRMMFSDGNEITPDLFKGAPGVAGATGLNGSNGLDGPAGPAGVAGVPGPKGDAGSVVSSAPSSINAAFVSFPADSTPTWFYASPSWVDLHPPIPFNVYKPDSILRLTINENVGVYGSKWCTLGVFIDTAVVPVCVASYSGVANTTVFNNQLFSCFINSLSPGVHNFNVRHRSQSCHYGNSALDAIGSNRTVAFEEIYK